MPDELKISRNYHEALRRLGIKDPGEVRVGVPIQLTAPVDDFSHLVAPVVVPVAGISEALGPTVANYEIIEVECRSSQGLWVIYAHTSTSLDAILYCQMTTRITIAPVVIAPGLESPADGSNPVQAVFRSGRTAAAPPRGPIIETAATFAVPIYVPPAHFFGLIAKTQNTFFQAGMIVQEIPLRAPGAE